MTTWGTGMDGETSRSGESRSVRGLAGFRNAVGGTKTAPRDNAGAESTPLRVQEVRSQPRATAYRTIPARPSSFAFCIARSL